MSVTPLPLGQARTLLELFEHAVTAHAAAVAFRRKKPNDYGLWKFSEVHEYVRRFSGALLELGVAPGDRVVILSDNRPEWGVAFFSIISVGGVAVPLDRMQPRAEIARALVESGAKLVVAPAAFTRPLMDLLDEIPGVQHILSMEEPRGTGKLIGQEELQERGVKSGRTYQEVTVGPDDVAVVAFTSGTVDQPRGVRITHANLVAELGALEAVDPYATDECQISLMPMNHLHELVLGFLRPFFAGGTVGYIHELAPTGVLEVMQEFQVTRIVGVPLLFSLLADELTERVGKLSGVGQSLFWKSLDMARSVRLVIGHSPGKLLFRDIHAAFGGRLRHAVVTGAAMPPEVVERVLDAGLPLDLGYALTEATSMATFGRAGTIPPRSVGRALPGVELAISDPSPEGVGEVLVRGRTVTSGYEGDPRFTTETLEGGWLHTGDLGYLDPEGNLYLRGRKREAIVTRAGRLVFPEEIERAYGHVKLVRELAVVGRTVRTGRGAEPVAVLVPDRDDEDAPKSPRALEKAVREAFHARSRELPEHERVKDAVLFAEGLPKTTSMKVKRAALARLLDQQEGAAGGMERRRKLRPTVAVMGTRELDLALLTRLLDSDETTAGRSVHELARLLESSTVVLTVWAAGELVGFARALSDGAFYATIGEIVVAPEWRRKGLGSLLLTRLCAHEAIAHVQRVVVTAAGPAAFLEKSGFERADGVFVKGQGLTA